MRLHRIVICLLYGSAVFFHIVSQTAQFSKKKVIEHKLGVSQIVSETFLIQWRTERVMIINTYGSLCKVSVSLVIFLWNEFSTYIFEKSSNTKHQHWAPSNSEPSALEVLVRRFISCRLSFLKRLSSVDWPSWRSERHGRRFPRFPLRKRFCLDRSCYLFVLGSNLRLHFCPGQERGAPSSAVCFQERPTQTSGNVRKLKV